MALRIYNTLTGKKEDFVPLQEGKVGMYVCGVTVYDLSHIGHARSTVVFDTIYRYLRHRGYEVTYVRNFTDIDDKIIKRANEDGVDYRVITEKYIHEFNVDMGSLGLEKPTIEPKATDHIPEIIRLVSTLIEKGYAYQSNGDVYDLSHIGHARSTVVFDAIYRYLRYRGYDVTYVRNFTDIDDKIIKRANEDGSITE